MLICDSCLKESDHFFLKLVDQREYWIGRCCIDLRQELCEELDDSCLNTMEICRIFNAVEDPRECHKGQKFGAIRGWKCQSERLNCTIHYSKIYRLLRSLEKKQAIKSKKTRFWDRTPLKTDIFRFWFVRQENFDERILKPKQLLGFV